MPYSLRTKLKHLAYERDITVKECERLINALDLVDAVEVIKVEIENSKEKIIGKYDLSTPRSQMPSYRIERNRARQECIDIIDKYISGKVDTDEVSN